MAYLTIRIKGEEGYRRVPLDKDRMVLGRSSACELAIASTAVSREHCVFLKVGDDWFVEDLGSSNGTKVGEERIAGRTPLVEKTVVRAGAARCTFHRGRVPDAAEDPEADGEDHVPTRARAATDPADAIPCEACSRWMSIAHHLPGDRMTCPGCGHRLTVPTLVVTAS